MPKMNSLGESTFPDLSVQISIQSYKEPSGTLLKKLRSLLDTAFGESEVIITETQNLAKKVGKQTLSRVSLSAEVYYPKD